MKIKRNGTPIILTFSSMSHYLWMSDTDTSVVCEMYSDVKRDKNAIFFTNLWLNITFFPFGTHMYVSKNNLRPQ